VYKLHVEKLEEHKESLRIGVSDFGRVGKLNGEMTESLGVSVFGFRARDLLRRDYFTSVAGLNPFKRCGVGIGL